MRLTNINVTNFQGLRHAALDVSAPLLLISGDNGAGKSSLLDAVSMAMTGQPRRVKLKKDLAELVTEGAKKGEAVITWAGEDGDESAAIALPSGKGAPLVDMPALPFVLDASKFAALDEKERRKMLFDLTGATVSPNEIARRLIERGAAEALVEKIKPMLRAGFPAAADQAKEYASESRGAWKSLTGEAYGSEKAEGWEPEAITSAAISQDDIDSAASEVGTLEGDLAEAQQSLGQHKQVAAQASQRAQRIAELQALADQIQRRENKLNTDKADLSHWKDQLAAAEAAGSGGKQGLLHDMARNLANWQSLAQRTQGIAAEGSGVITPWFVLQEMDTLHVLMERYNAEHGPVAEGSTNAELAKRIPEFKEYVQNITNSVANSERDLRAAQDAKAQMEALQAEPAVLPAEAIGNAEQLINELRQQLDGCRARHGAMVDAFNAANSRGEVIAKAAQHHADVVAWETVKDALSPGGIPADILAGALDPFNDLLKTQSAGAKWQTVAITSDIAITYGGRQYGLLSESEKWRCDALLSIAIARLSGIGFVTLDRFDVLQPSARPQILSLLLTLTRAGDLGSAILAGTMKEPIAKVPAGIQQVWVAGGVIDSEPASAAA